MAVKFSNNAKTTLSSGITSSATSIAVVDASAWPTLGSGDHTLCTLAEAGDADALEIVKVTAISGNTLTVVRAQEGTTARSFSTADKAELRITAGIIEEAFSYAETDTLDAVTGRGATTTNAVTVGNLTSTGIDDNASATVMTVAGGSSGNNSIIQSVNSNYGSGFYGSSANFGFEITDGGVGGKTIRIKNNSTDIFSHNQVQNIIDMSNASSVTVAGFTSTGIDDNATSTAITINSSEQVGISTTAADALTVTAESTTIGPNMVFANTDGNLARIASAETNTLRFETGPSNTTAVTINGSQQVDFASDIVVDGAVKADSFKSTAGSTTAISLASSGDATFSSSVSATLFTGPLTGNVTGNVTGSAGSCTGNAATATKAYVNDYNGSTTMRILGSHDGINSNGNVYSTFDLKMDMSTDTIYAATFSGALSGNAATATKARVTADSAGNRALVLCSADGTTRDENLYKDSGTSAYFNTSNNTLVCPTFSGALSGNATTATRVEYRDGRTDGTFYPVLWGADVSGYTHAFSCNAVKIQSSTGTLSATTFLGALNGNATTATSVGGVSSPLSTDSTQNITAAKEFQDNIELRFGNGADVRMDFNGTDFYCRSYSHGGRLLFQGENSNGQNKALVYMDPDGETGIYHTGAKKGYTYASGWRVTGNLLATSNVYAYYSDTRLKDVKGQITEALDKVDAIETFYYTHNDTARDLGYEGEEMQVGVSAQSVEAVMPEVVHLAPIDDDGEGNSVSGEDYVTVDYPRLVPLLIEAIKELRAEVRGLKNASY